MSRLIKKMDTDHKKHPELRIPAITNANSLFIY